MGSGRMAAMVRDFDWSSTPLGPACDWPPELKGVVGQILGSGFPSAVVWGPGLVTIYNDAFLPILGDKPEALGRSFADVWAEAWEEIGPIATRAFDGEATFIEDFPLVIDRHGDQQQAWFTFCYSPLRLADGSVAGMLDTVVETTATVRGRADLALLNDELGHRLKNTLALVQAIAIQTLRGVTPVKPVRDFQERIVALGRAHDVLLRQNWSTVSLEEIARQTLAPLDALGQIAVAGPDVELGSRSALTLSLIFHELATNAAKYGALSVPGGRVTLGWTLAGDRLSLGWRETGGPAVAEPSRRGFGSLLIDRGLGGAHRAKRRYPAAGFELDLDAALRELGQ